MRYLATLAAMLLAGAAEAQVLDGDTARAQLFDTRGYALQINANLAPRDRETVKALVPLMGQQLSVPVTYYSAIAYSPGDGLVSESLQAAMNHHSPASAAAAAVAACERARASSTPCQVAAQIVPRGYQVRGFTLSQGASAAVAGDYRRARSPKALAISPAGGGWGIGAGDAQAVAACARSGARDCRVVIRD